jgi:hypothetical protein
MLTIAAARSPEKADAKEAAEKKTAVEKKGCQLVLLI